MPGAPCAICSTILISVLGARTKGGGKRMILKIFDNILRDAMVDGYDDTVELG